MSNCRYCGRPFSHATWCGENPNRPDRLADWMEAYPRVPFTSLAPPEVHPDDFALEDRRCLMADHYSGVCDCNVGDIIEGET